MLSYKQLMDQIAHFEAELLKEKEFEGRLYLRGIIKGLNLARGRKLYKPTNPL